MTAVEEITFGPALISDVFAMVGASTAWFDKSKLGHQGPAIYPFVSRTGTNNGIGSFCSIQSKDPEPGNAITIGLDTQTVNYQPIQFYTSQNIQVLRHPSLNQWNALVLCASISRQMGRFSWGGNGVTLGRLKRTRIMVPVVSGESGLNVVDWEGMTTLGRQLALAISARAQGALRSQPDDDDTLPHLNFKPMLITDTFESMSAAKSWFDFVRAKRTGTNAHPYVARLDGANSISAFVPHQGFDPPNAGNAITIGVDTSTVFYQPVPFYTSVKIQILRHSKMTEDSGLMLVALIREQMSKFKWGNGASLTRLKATRIMVPVTDDGYGREVVDWVGLAAYGRALRVRAERALKQVAQIPQ